ncbi:PREDICTED: uncharacterized protein LOC105556042 isoform X2 [Vollenhovia emeryi]|uniref:uncharacterized protein LOC105556042 isoform X2 n=1 Tax=Vollenhovia emeryi TaxID=411798 RepID=UPI0005F3F6FB|nr:PREDICTED: uncharacterized protein LOC105556042 isoform X2 [Vollenhovia emeryi]
MDIEEKMWARVEYELDKQKADVPLSFFKDHEVVFRELQSCITRSMYKVFWSNKQSDTPKKILKEQGQILDIEKIVCGKKSVPVTGYYTAKLLQYADSLRDLLALCEDQKGRRPIQPTMKTTERKENKKMTGKNTMSKYIEEARQHNLLRLSDDPCDQNEKRGKLTSEEIKSSEETKLSNKVCSLRELSNDGDDLRSVDCVSKKDDCKGRVIKKQRTVSTNNTETTTSSFHSLQEELREWKLKYAALETKYKDFKDRYLKVLDLNVRWQEKELSRHSSHRSSHKPESSKDKNAKHDSYNSKDLLKKCNNQLEYTQSSSSSSSKKTQSSQRRSDFNRTDGSDIIINDDLPIINDIPLGATVLNIDPTNSPPKILSTTINSLSSSPRSQHANHVLPAAGDMNFEKNLNNSVARAINKNDILDGPAYNIQPPKGVSAVSQAQFDRLNKAETGSKGDWKFVKRIADMMWTRVELSNRSASGRPCPNKINCEARQACSPDKKKYLSDLLETRIFLENASLNPMDLHKRLSNINKILSSKIKTVRKTFKDISSEEEN